MPENQRMGGSGWSWLLGDTLTRPEVKHLNGRVVLVTGAGGSIGSEIIRKLEKTNCGRIVMVDSSEHALYQAVRSLKKPKSNRIVPLIADVRHPLALDAVWSKYTPDYVLHAAALKHVPMLETGHNFIEAVRTNVTGTRNVLEATRKHAKAGRTPRVVVISTDKAVNPSSTMGLTKKLGEQVAHLYNTDALSVSVVRFGNVFGSSGSAVPLFKEQIKNGGPVTITDPRMTRYMMTLSNAVYLVLQSTGETDHNLCVLDMGEPIKIVDLAKVLIRLDGKEPGMDIRMSEIGIRPGEKLHEELFTEEEAKGVSSAKGMFRLTVKCPTQQHYLLLQTLMTAADERKVETAAEIALELVPEFSGKVGV